MGEEPPPPALSQDRPESGEHHDRGGVAGDKQHPGDRRPHEPVTRGEKTYFAAVGVLAAWVGLPAYLAPERVAAVLPFPVPALHARLIGAMYLSGLTIMLGSLLARRWADVRVVPAITAIWTGGLLLVTLLHLEEFDFATTQTRIWFGAYVVYPLVGVWILAKRRGEGAATGSNPALAARAGLHLMGQGVALSGLGLALLLFTGPVVRGWPWPVTPLLAQVYAAPFLAYGIGSLLLAALRTGRQTRVALVGIGVFALAALAASVIHRDLFGPGPATWAWFAALAVMTAASALVAGTSRKM